MFGFSKQTVAVTFVETGTGKKMGVSTVPLAQLPETFAIATNLDLAGEQYAVVSAEPPTKTDFAKSGKLVVTLRKLEMVDPKTILFSLPSICGAALPAVGFSQGSDGFCVLHEDDWRQCEFVAVGDQSNIASELADIRHIHETASEKVGFRRIHVRHRISRPISQLSWKSIAKLLDGATPIAGVGFSGAEAIVRNSIGVKFPDGTVVWGIENGAELDILCVEGVRSAAPSTIAVLKNVSDTFSLVLVNWCRCQVYAPRGTLIQNATEYF